MIKDALVASLGGLASYPSTAGGEPLRRAISAWLGKRYGVEVDPLNEILPVAGSREALFALAQTIVDGSRPGAVVLCPNPFYQIYEGAALLAGATPYFANSDPARNFACDYATVPDDVLGARPTALRLLAGQSDRRRPHARRTGASCSPCPTATVLRSFRTSATPRSISTKARAARGLDAARRLGRDWDAAPDGLQPLEALERARHALRLRGRRCALMKRFLLYRTYHGCALSPVTQSASIAAWGDEAHVVENRAMYAQKFRTVTPMLASVLDVGLPDAAFYLWVDVRRSGLDDESFARRLYADYNVTVLPGAYLARDAHGTNPGRHFVRIALVASVEECVEGARRIVDFCEGLARARAA